MAFFKRLFSTSGTAYEVPNEDESSAPVRPSRGRGVPKRSSSTPQVFGQNIPPLAELLAIRSSAVSSTGSEPGSTCGDTSNQSVLSTHFIKISTKHRGASCRVMEAYDRKTTRRVTIKAFSKQGMTGAMRDRIQRERDALIAAEVASVPNVIRLLGAYEDEDAKFTAVENCLGETLIELIANHGGKISEQRCRQCVARPALQALAGLHSLGIVHRHLKPEHLIISKLKEGHSLRIIDFLDSADKSKHPLNSRVGDLPYMAPEVLAAPITEEIFHQVLIAGMDERDLPQYDEKADVWSLGVIIYESLSGQQPFMGDNPLETLELARSMVSDVDESGVPLFIATNSRLSPASAQFVSDILVLDAAKRPSAEDLLNHPWLATASSASREPSRTLMK